MIKVQVFKQSNYPINTPPIKKKLSKFFENHGITSDAEVSVAIVGKEKMIEVGDRYKKDKKLHNVFSFTPTEVKGTFQYPPDGMIRLGEIVICYPVVVEEAKAENKLINDKAYELIEHGALHLLGIHHDGDYHDRQ